MKMELRLITKKDYLLRNILGLFLTLLGIICLIVDPVGRIAKWQITISQGTLAENLWKNVPVDVYNRIYLFNVTNSEEYLNGTDSKMILNQIGPYVFREVRNNTNLTYNDNGTLTYHPKFDVIFVPEKSVGNINTDIIVTLNVPLMGLLSVLSKEGSLKKFGANFFIKLYDPKQFINVTVNDFLWGYEDELVASVGNLLPYWIDFEKFGILDRLYAKKNEVFTVNMDSKRAPIYSIYDWNGSPGLTQWKYTELNTSLPCNRLRGAFEGLIFPQGFSPENGSFHVFKKMFCRTLKLDFVRQVKDESGLMGNSYTLTKDIFKCRDPSNKCFWPEDDPDECLPDGLSDISPCFYDIPLAVSQPHFLNCDPKLLENFIGVDPNTPNLDSFYNIQPDVGLPLKGAARIQLNLVIKDISFNSYGKRFSNIVYPVAWIDSRIDKLPDDLLLLILLGYVYLPQAEIVLGCLFSIMGISLFLYSTIVMCKIPREIVHMTDQAHFPRRQSIVEMKDILKGEFKDEVKSLI